MELLVHPYLYMVDKHSDLERSLFSMQGPQDLDHVYRYRLYWYSIIISFLELELWSANTLLYNFFTEYVHRS